MFAVALAAMKVSQEPLVSCSLLRKRKSSTVVLVCWKPEQNLLSSLFQYLETDNNNDHTTAAGFYSNVQEWTHSRERTARVLL